MPPDLRVLAELLTLVALLAATIQYCELVKRRGQGREIDQTGLQGLVRVLLAE
jgi:hypothetical protein